MREEVFFGVMWLALCVVLLYLAFRLASHKPRPASSQPER